MTTSQQPRHTIILTIHLDADPLFHITATDTFMHLARWLQHDGIIATATLNIPGTGTLSAVTNLEID
jgi:hypothetical protein